MRWARSLPDPTTAGDFCRRLAEADVVELMECINAVRPRLWRGRGRDLLGPRNEFAVQIRDSAEASIEHGNRVA